MQKVIRRAFPKDTLAILNDVLDLAERGKVGQLAIVLTTVDGKIHIRDSACDKAELALFGALLTDAALSDALRSTE